MKKSFGKALLHEFTRKKKTSKEVFFFRVRVIQELLRSSWITTYLRGKLCFPSYEKAFGLRVECFSTLILKSTSKVLAREICLRQELCEGQIVLQWLKAIALWLVKKCCNSIFDAMKTPNFDQPPSAFWGPFRASICTRKITDLHYLAHYKICKKKMGNLKSGHQKMMAHFKSHRRSIFLEGLFLSN